MYEAIDNPVVASATVFERATIAALIQRERAARDAAQWAEMATFYHPESSIDVAWFQGSGQEFVQATRKTGARTLLTFMSLESPSLISAAIARSRRPHALFTGSSLSTELRSR